MLANIQQVPEQAFSASENSQPIYCIRPGA